MRNTFAGRVQSLKWAGRRLCLTIRKEIKKARRPRVKRAYFVRGMWILLLIGLGAVALIYHGYLIADHEQRTRSLEIDNAIWRAAYYRTEVRLRRLELAIDVNIQARENLIYWIESSQDFNRCEK